MKIFTKGLVKPDCFLSEKIYTKPCAFGELGAYAKRKIKKGEIVCIFTGKIIDKNTYDALPKELKNYALGIDEGMFLAAYSLSEKDLDADDYINHSCDPNLGFVGKNILVAMRTIKKDEELSFDYAMCDTETDSFLCKCNQKNCRKIITGDDWKLPKLQKKYKRYFSDYILRKIDAVHHEDTLPKDNSHRVPLQLQALQSDLN